MRLFSRSNVEDQLMYKTLGGVASAAMLVAIAVPGQLAAAERRQDPGIHKQVAGEEFSSQRRYYRRRYVVRRYRPAYFGYYPGFYPYAYPYYYRPYYYPRPYAGFGFWPFWW